MRAKLQDSIGHAKKFILAIESVLADDTAEIAEDKIARVLREWSIADRLH